MPMWVRSVRATALSPWTRCQAQVAAFPGPRRWGCLGHTASSRAWMATRPEWEKLIEGNSVIRVWSEALGLETGSRTGQRRRRSYQSPQPETTQRGPANASCRSLPIRLGRRVFELTFQLATAFDTQAWPHHSEVHQALRQAWIELTSPSLVAEPRVTIGTNLAYL
jgi:hypothetical protein